MRARTPLVLVACIRLRRGADRVVVASPTLDDDLGLAQSVENLAVEQLIAKAGVEALDVAVLPGAAPLVVALAPTGDLLMRAKHLFVAARTMSCSHHKTSATSSGSVSLAIA